MTRYRLGISYGPVFLNYRLDDDFSPYVIMNRTRGVLGLHLILEGSTANNLAGIHLGRRC